MPADMGQVDVGTMAIPSERSTALSQAHSQCKERTTDPVGVMLLDVSPPHTHLPSKTHIATKW